MVDASDCIVVEDVVPGSDLTGPPTKNNILSYMFVNLDTLSGSNMNFPYTTACPLFLPCGVEEALTNALVGKYINDDGLEVAVVTDSCLTCCQEVTAFGAEVIAVVTGLTRCKIEITISHSIRGPSQANN